MFEKLKSKFNKNEKYDKLIASMLVNEEYKALVDTETYTTLNYTALIGKEEDKPRFINMYVEYNMMIEDHAGDGKTACIDSIIASLALKNFKENLQFYIIDTDGNYGIYKDLPHTVAYAHTKEEVRDLLDKIIYELNLRYQQWQHFHNVKPERLGLSHIFFVLDDLDVIRDLDLTDAEMESVAKLLTVGHTFGIHCILGTKGNITDIVDDTMIKEYKIRILFSAKDEEESFALIKEGGAQHLTEGDDAMVLRIPKRTTRDDDEPEENFRLAPYKTPEDQTRHIIENWK